MVFKIDPSERSRSRSFKFDVIINHIELGALIFKQNENLDQYQCPLSVHLLSGRGY